MPNNNYNHRAVIPDDASHPPVWRLFLCRRAGTGKDFPRKRNKGDRAEGVVEPLLQYPWPGGKTSPRGYRRRFPANIPVARRKNPATRVQEKISREYTRGRAEKPRRAGTGEDFPRIYPWPSGKTPPRGYRERFFADIPVNMRNLYPRELYFSPPVTQLHPGPQPYFALTAPPGQ